MHLITNSDSGCHAHIQIGNKNDEQMNEINQNDKKHTTYACVLPHKRDEIRWK